MTKRSAHWLLVLAAAAATALSVGCGGDDDGEQPPSCLPECQATRAYDARAYELHASFDWDAAELIASEEITLATGGEAIVELDATVTVERIHAGDVVLAFSTDDAAETLAVDLTPLSPGADPVTFTVEYRAPTSSSLFAAGPRDDDPVRTRMVYTDSEPRRGHQWLVEKDDPDDRATWAVELTVAADEDVIANGLRASDQTEGDSRVVRYEMDQPLPTYLMAFAAGEIEHTDRLDGPVPLAVWHRRGLAVDAAGTMDVVAEAMTAIGDLIGPYPWDSYAVVLVPQYGGGMENATITFNLEESSEGNVSVGLNTHELAHQWFGDWVTMRTYDDVWVKEGMATFLSAEADRRRRGDGSVPRYFGLDFTFSPGDAIVDPTLTGLSKYTSGPYERAAWMITQIRARVGEEAFWAGLRRALDEHALGSIDGESFVRSFAPALDEAAIQQVLAALPQTAVPSVGIQTAPGEGATDVTFTLDDPAAMLLDPMEITVVDADGQATTSLLGPGEPLSVAVPDGGYLAPDERGIHPYWEFTFQVDVGAFFSEVGPLMVPSAPAALEAFEDRSASHQEHALYIAGLPVGAGELTGFYDALDSVFAQQQAAFGACAALSFGPEGDWSTPLGPILSTPAVASYDTQYANCGAELPMGLLEAELSDLADTTDPDGLARVEYLISFDFGADSFALISPIATGAPAAELRDLAIDRLATQAEGYYSQIPSEQGADWSSFFRARIADATSSRRFRIAWPGSVALLDVEALPLAADALHRIPMSAATQVGVVCDAFAVSAQEPGAWEAFQEAAQPWSELSPDAAGVLQDPSLCQQ